MTCGFWTLPRICSSTLCRKDSSWTRPVRIALLFGSLSLVILFGICLFLTIKNQKEAYTIPIQPLLKSRNLLYCTIGYLYDWRLLDEAIIHAVPVSLSLHGCFYHTCAGCRQSGPPMFPYRRTAALSWTRTQELYYTERIWTSSITQPVSLRY